jgi:hypothetical protein
MKLARGGPWWKLATMRRALDGVLMLATAGFVAGCLDLGGGGGGGVSAGAEGVGGRGAPSCGLPAGHLNGAVFYWAASDSPDSLPADSVDVLLTQGGPTYRVQTTVQGTFSLDVAAGRWAIVPDVYTGCENETVEQVDVEACETTDVELVISQCAQ